MSNAEDHIEWARNRIESDYEPGRERSLVLTKLEEAELWLTKAKVKGSEC